MEEPIFSCLPKSCLSICLALLTHNIGNGREYFLVMTRCSTNVLTSLVIPIVFFNILVNLVYLLPIDSGERVGYSVTLVLTFAVLTMQVNSLFPSSGKMLAMGKGLLHAMALVWNFLLVNKSDK